MSETKLDTHVERARQAIREWPAWMRHTAYFAGSEDAPLPDDAEDHSFDE